MIVNEPKQHKSQRTDMVAQIGSQLRERFSLEEDKENEENIIQSISRGIEFRGANLWTLIFAIFIASIGLNVNSTAVIIGAMLISPLMGPIMGIGLGIGINDLLMIQRALKNLSIAAGISLLTSTIYFLISPLHIAQSELLARTSPTVWDAFIAFVGGLAGIVAGTRRDKVTNVIPGVAIATALMPPLCTAGYGLATLNLYYFASAFYLFLINGVCISLATFLIVRFLGFHLKEYPSPEIERHVRNTIWIAVFVVLIPSTYLGYQIVRKTIFEQEAKRFVTNEGNFEYRQVIGYKAYYNRRQSTLELTVVGEPLPTDSVNSLRARMPAYGLDDVSLVIKQGSFKDTEVDVNAITNTVTDQVIKYSQSSIARKDQIIDSLNRVIATDKNTRVPVMDLRNELKTLMPDVQTFTAANSLVMNARSNTPDTVMLVYAKFSRRHTTAERRRIERWLQQRTKSRKIKLIIE
ncbi:TIGR00341 family protein [Spirosoma sp. KUDC1026]|uniref:TIGR00341 family protein n=1 Tax=Spirosoma sp. KUDC1026 TaxID=2745947 RepID=UPI00159BC7D7|nr:TIGR00341 family protein [Spirosoma sp. KUDC1026]QKZ11108.1 TIGR00341 family protein [Spirosoma sp. KUDC1026]